MSPAPDACPQCGAAMIPVLEPDRPRTAGPLGADPVVHLRCPHCPETEAPSLAGA